MLNLKYLTMPAAAPLAGSLLALALSTPAPVADHQVPCVSPNTATAEVHELEVHGDYDAGRDVTDYPSPAPMEWTLGPQSEQELTVADDAQVEANGLSWKIIRAGDESKAPPNPGAVARMRFVGWTADGEPLPGARALTMIPMDVPLDEMVPGFSQAAQKMHPGEMRRVWVPQELGFAGRENRPEGTLIYDMELVSWHESH